MLVFLEGKHSPFQRVKIKPPSKKVDSLLELLNLFT